MADESGAPPAGPVVEAPSEADQARADDAKVTALHEEVEVDLGAATTYQQLPSEQVKMLAEPLDRARVKGRKGRGGSQFSYLETHDVKRNLTRIFGYGGWGKRIVEQVQVAAVQVEKDNGAGKAPTKGWHVAYRCVVRLTVRGCEPTEGSGYGDAVEYGPGALATCNELALKESESDALKRAATDLGDQFGLILYAKAEDQARIESMMNADQSRAPAGPSTNAPVTVREALVALEVYTADPKPWIAEAFSAIHKGKKMQNPSHLPNAERMDLVRRLQGVVVDLERKTEAGLLRDATAEKVQAELRDTFGKVFNGETILGPDPFVPPIPF